MAAPVLQFKRGLLANLPGLRAGEPGFTTDSYDLYVGIDSTSNNNKFFGSHRYWTKGTATTGSGVNLVEGTNNGTQYLTLKAPDSLAGITTYTFPATPTADYFLKTAADGTLSWAAVILNSFAGIVTFTDTTDNTLGNENTGSVQFDGGVGIAKNLTVKQNLYVGGYSEFVGVATFRGGTINLGDSNTDNINVGGEFISNLTPNDDNTYDIGIGTQRWRNANFAGVVTATTFSGTATTATRATTVDTTTTSTNQSYYVPFVTNLTGTTGETLRVGAGLSVNPATGDVGVTSSLSVGGASNAYIKAGGGSNAMYLFSNGDVSFQAKVISNSYRSSSNATNTLTFVDLDASFARNLLIAGVATVTSNLSVNGGTINSSSGIVTVFDTGVTTVNEYGQATTIGIGSTAATLTLRPSTVVGTNATQTLYNTIATTVNAFGAATTIGIGAATGTATINNATLTLPNATTVNVNGANPTFTGTSTGTLTFFNTNITTVNEYGQATTIGIGSTAATLTLRPSTVVGTNATQTLYDTVATTLNFGRAATSFNIGANTGTLTIGNPTVVGTQATQNLYNTVATNLNFGGAATALVMGAATGITTIRNSLRVTNSLYDSSNSAGTSGQFLVATAAGIGWTTISGVSAGTISTATRSQTVDITTTNAQTAGLVFGAAGNGATLYNDADLTYNSNTNTLNVGILSATSEVRTAAVKAADGTAAITITNTTGAVATNSDLTVGGNLYINGSTTQVNTSQITVEDRTIELGIVDGAAPSSTTTWDLGVLFNYNDGSAKKSALIWEQGDARFKLGSVVTDGGGTGTTNPQITFTTYAALELGELWINNTCTGGSSQVIACSGSTLVLQNITLDAGTF